MLRVDLCALNQIYQTVEGLERKQQIQQQKQAIYAYRNQILSRLTGQVIDQASFAKTEHGKPYLKGQVLAFNHSHSQQHYALLTGPQQLPIGIDVEDLNRRVRMEALAQHAFHPEEYAHWKDLQEDRAFWFRVWTTKEAVLKAHGLGIRLTLKNLNTQVHPDRDAGYIQHDLLGQIAYQNFHLDEVMLTVAWCNTAVLAQENRPSIEMIQH